MEYSASVQYQENETNNSGPTDMELTATNSSSSQQMVSSSSASVTRQEVSTSFTSSMQQQHMSSSFQQMESSSSTMRQQQHHSSLSNHQMSGLDSQLTGHTDARLSESNDLQLVTNSNGRNTWQGLSPNPALINFANLVYLSISS